MITAATMATVVALVLLASPTGKHLHAKHKRNSIGSLCMAWSVCPCGWNRRRRGHMRLASLRPLPGAGHLRRQQQRQMRRLVRQREVRHGGLLWRPQAAAHLHVWEVMPGARARRTAQQDYVIWFPVEEIRWYKKCQELRPISWWNFYFVMSVALVRNN
jgi:hypothetical protein